MTIIAGFSFSRQGSAPLNLAAQLARTTGEKIIAAAVVERAVPAGVDPIEDEYRGYLASRATASLKRVVDQLPGDLHISVTTHHSASIPDGLMELVDQHGADLVVVGSSQRALDHADLEPSVGQRRVLVRAGVVDREQLVVSVEHGHRDVRHDAGRLSRREIGQSAHLDHAGSSVS